MAHFYQKPKDNVILMKKTLVMLSYRRKYKYSLIINFLMAIALIYKFLS